MNVALRLTGLALVLVFGLLAQKADKPDLSGTWQLDLKLTRFGELPQPKNLVLQIEHREPEIQILTVTTTRTGDTRETLKLTTDGARHEHSVQGQPCTATAQWHWWEGRRLVVEVKCQEVSHQRRYTLGTGGKILTTVLTMTDKSGEKKAYEFFFKQ